MRAEIRKWGTGRVGSLDKPWPSTEGRMGSLKPAQHTLMVGEPEGPSPHHKKQWHHLATHHLSCHESLKAKSLDYSHSFSFVLLLFARTSTEEVCGKGCTPPTRSCAQQPSAFCLHYETSSSQFKHPSNIPTPHRRAGHPALCCLPLHRGTANTV